MFLNYPFFEACHPPNVQCDAPVVSKDICVPEQLKCDGKYHCQNGEDEKGCSNYPTCQSDEWTCESGECIPIGNKCDGNEDCSDGSDEIMECGNKIKNF